MEETDSINLVTSSGRIDNEYTFKNGKLDAFIFCAFFNQHAVTAEQELKLEIFEN